MERSPLSQQLLDLASVTYKFDMHVVVLFHNIGGYHAARLRAAYDVCTQEGWQFTALQETDSAQEHPWGDLKKEITFPLETLLPTIDAPDARDRDPQASIAASRLPACLDRLNPNILVVPGWGYPNSRAALKWAKKHCIPTVLMSESKWDDEPRQWWKEKLKSLLYVRQFKAALVGGQPHHEYLQTLGFPENGISLGYDIVDNSHFLEGAKQAQEQSSLLRQQHPDMPQRPYFITVTRFIERKNVLRLIDAYAHYCDLASQDRDGASLNKEQIWDLVICGSGVEEASIRARISQYQLESFIHLPGFKPYQEIPHWFGLASTFIHPALSEQWGLVVNEALASGLPALVSNRCGCFSELIVEGVNGFGFDPEDAEQLAGLMLKMSTGAIDLTCMSKAALDHIQQFSPSRFGHGLKQSVDYALAH